MPRIKHWDVRQATSAQAVMHPLDFLYMEFTAEPIALEERYQSWLNLSPTVVGQWTCPVARLVFWCPTAWHLPEGCIYKGL